MKKHKRTFLILFGNLIAFLILYIETQAQSSEGLIYGRVHTYSTVYEGQIRWGKEEASWSDIFNSTKVSSNYKSYEDIGKEDRNRWEDYDWGINSIWEDKYSNVTHQFSCQFGDIAELKDISKSKLTIKFKNGLEMRLNGGSNDIGAKIRVYDNELGEVLVNWDRIDKVEFLPTPRSLEGFGGSPMFGTVETYRKGIYTGYVQWDHDERLGVDMLDGDNRDGDVSIAFQHIKSIEKEGNGSNVILNSGREFYLTGSNDVNNSNRGIIVTVEGIGRVDIPWKSFDKVTFVTPKTSGPAYSAYPPSRGLSGVVYTYDDQMYSGKIIYDIDETWEFEILEGDDDEMEFEIPFRNIKSIVPKNYNYSMIELRTGDKLLLGDKRDVTDSNGGLLVFTNDSAEPEFIPWKKIVEIVFD